MRTSPSAALTSSLKSWGVSIGDAIATEHPPLLIMKLCNTAPESIRGALEFGDLALATIQKKLIFGHVSYLAWNRISGTVPGATYSDDSWSPIKPGESYLMNALVQQPPIDMWDSFISRCASDDLTTLSSALCQNLKWERSAKSAADNSHRFAFVWIAIESTIPHGQRDEGTFVRRLTLLAGAPRGADSKKIRSVPAMRQVFESHRNRYGNQWVCAIKQMYSYRCQIVHNGDTSSTEQIDDPKLDWLFHLAVFLNERLQLLLLEAMGKGVESLEEFWDSFAVKYLYSTESQWVKNKTFIDTVQINHRWDSSRLPAQ